MAYSKETIFIYYAAPLFNQSEMGRNKVIVEHLEDHLLSKYQDEIDLHIFLPQRDAGEITAEEGSEEFRKVIYQKDLKELVRADIVIADFTGRVPDEGTVFEAGFAVGNDTKLVGLFDDKRSFIGGYPNNMLYMGCDYRVYDLDKLEEIIEKIIFKEIL